MPKSRFLNVANMSFNAIHKNKNLVKIFEFYSRYNMHAKKSGFWS